MTLVEDYLDRLDLRGHGKPDAESLRALHVAHLQRIPFENLDVAMDVPGSLAIEDLADKILRRGRGGFCYELNGLFARLLAELGYGVVLLAGQVWTGSKFSAPLDHLALRVTDHEGVDWLVDVGFGRHTCHPLRWTPDVEQHDPNGSFRLEFDATGDVIVHSDAGPQYRLDAHPRELADFTAMCWYQQHSPNSHFTRSTVCSRETPDGRVTLSERTLIVTAAGNEQRSTLLDDEAVLAAYREHFGFELSTVPRLST